jgi:Fur family ferric uptake transcriptional regulator/Fur family peroxide stress response transcriptional regulator
LPLSQIVAERVPQAAQFKITGGEVSLTGLCPECQKKAV